jgi:hypothetical protein
MGKRDEAKSGCRLRQDDASPERRQNWQIGAAGYGIHWPEIDED